MAQLLVRNLEEALVEKLKARAAANQCSAEEEHRRILAQALTGPVRRPLAAVLAEMPDVGEDEDFARES